MESHTWRRELKYQLLLQVQKHFEFNSVYIFLLDEDFEKAEKLRQRMKHNLQMARDRVEALCK